MGPEIWVGVGAIFVAGGAIGAAGTLLAQWVFRKVGNPTNAVGLPDPREAALLRSEVAEIALKLQNVDARLDFQEQLLGGSLHTTPPPPRLAADESSEEAD